MKCFKRNLNPNNAKSLSKMSISHISKSIYQLDISPPKFLGQLNKDIRCSVAIIGGGLTGISTALSLSEKGYDVCLFEAGNIGDGGSGRNGGQICQGWSSSFEKLSKYIDPEFKEDMWQAGLEGSNLIKERIKKYKIECDVHWGYVHTAIHKGHMRELEAYQKSFEAHGYNHLLALNNKSSLFNYICSDVYIGGLYDAGSGHLHPLKYLIGLSKAASIAGAKIYTNSSIFSIQTANNKNKLITKQGHSVIAEQLVICGNAYLGAVSPKNMRGKIAPVTSSVMATEPLNNTEIKRAIPSGAAIADGNTALNYFRIDKQNRMIFGGRASYLNTDPINVEKDLKKRMRAVFPDLMHKKIQQAWSGRIGITVNRLPHFGRISDSAIYVQGYSGHGVAFSGVAGNILSDAVSGKRDRFNQLTKILHLPFPGGPLRTPILALGMGWYKMRDYFRI